MQFGDQGIAHRSRTLKNAAGNRHIGNFEDRRGAGFKAADVLDDQRSERGQIGSALRGDFLSHHVALFGGCNHQRRQAREFRRRIGVGKFDQLGERAELPEITRQIQEAGWALLIDGEKTAAQRFKPEKMPGP